MAIGFVEVRVAAPDESRLEFGSRVRFLCSSMLRDTRENGEERHGRRIGKRANSERTAGEERKKRMMGMKRGIKVREERIELLSYIEDRKGTGRREEREEVGIDPSPGNRSSPGKWDLNLLPLATLEDITYRIFDTHSLYLLSAPSSSCFHALLETRLLVVFRYDLFQGS